MDTTLIFLQHYWWFIVSLLGALLVFLLFVQGGQGMLYELGETPLQRDMIVNSLGRKWELTFTTLVTFGGAFFASFPLFYSTSFGGAFYVWMLVLLAFVIQAVAYEYRRKPGNLLGSRTYETFLVINGIMGPLLLGMALGTLFSGAPFRIDRFGLADMAGGPQVISQWATPWHGLDALADFRPWLLGITAVFLSRTLATHYFLSNIDDAELRKVASSRSMYNAVPMVIALLLFICGVLWSDGASFGYDDPTYIVKEKFRYLHTMIELPFLPAMILAGIALVLTGIHVGWRFASRRAIWFSGIGTVLVVLPLLLCAGWGQSCYYISTVDMQSSLNICNSSSSLFTLKVMSFVSLLVPFVVAYIWYVWRALDRQPVTSEEIAGDDHAY